MVYDKIWLVIIMLIIWAFGGYFLYTKLKQCEAKPIRKFFDSSWALKKFMLVFAIPCLLITYLIHSCIDSRVDEWKTVRAEIIGHYKLKGKWGQSVIFRIDARYEGKIHTFTISKEEFNKVNIGDSVEFEVGDGSFGLVIGHYGRIIPQ